MRHHKLLNLEIRLGNYDEFIAEIINLAKSATSSYVCLVNVHMFIEAQMSQTFLDVVNNADIAAPDGKPITWGLNFLYGIRQPRVAGMDLLPDIIKQAESNDIPVFFYGSTEQILSATKNHIRNANPGLKLAGFISPPFKPITPKEEEEHIKLINNSGARIIFVVLGCPKQEYWMNRMTGKINGVMIGIGGALPVLIGLQKRAPKWMQNAGLEWCFRLSQEPRRLWKRYLSTNTSYLRILFIEKSKKISNRIKHIISSKHTQL